VEDFFFLFGGSSRSCAQTPKPPDWCFFTSLTYKFRYKENKLRRKTLTENQLEWYHLSSRKPHKKKKMTAKIFSESIYVSLYKDNELSTTHIHTHKAGYYNQEECWRSCALIMTIKFLTLWNVWRPQHHTRRFLGRHDETSNNLIDRYPKQS
jgi:hypothetical protein